MKGAHTQFSLDVGALKQVLDLGRNRVERAKQRQKRFKVAAQRAFGWGAFDRLRIDRIDLEDWGVVVVCGYRESIRPIFVSKQFRFKQFVKSIGRSDVVRHLKEGKIRYAAYLYKASK